MNWKGNNQKEKGKHESFFAVDEQFHVCEWLHIFIIRTNFHFRIFSSCTPTRPGSACDTRRRNKERRLKERERARYREISKTPAPKALSSCWPYNRFPESSSRRDLTRASTAWRVSNSPAYLAWETIDRPCWRCLSDLSERCRLVRKRRRKRWRQDIAGCQRGSTVFWKRP